MLRSTLMMALFAFSASVYAEGLGYTYLQGTYGQVVFDDSVIDVDGDGFGISGAFAVSDSFHVFGEYQTAELDFNVDLNLLEMGLGYNAPISDTVDIVGRLAYVNIEAKAPGVPSADDNGYSVGVGLRGAVSDAVELNGGLDYVDSSDSSGEARFSAGFLFNISETFTVGLKGTWWEDVNIYQLGARWYF